MVCKQASTVGVSHGQSSEDLCFLRPCLCLVPNSVDSTFILARISELCTLTLVHESKKDAAQLVHVQRNSRLAGCTPALPLPSPSRASLERCSCCSCFFCSTFFMHSLLGTAKALASPANLQTTLLCHCPLRPFLASLYDRNIVLHTPHRIPQIMFRVFTTQKTSPSSIR